MERMQKLHPEFTYEIVNFDTKGDQILNIALPKIGDKGLFTKELEDALETARIDFVVHSLKDMPCQTLPDGLILAGVPEREDPSDALVMSKRWENVKFSLDDLAENSVIGTSSLRRISQLKQKYPQFKFETIRGNLQTRFSKLDDPVEKKFDAIILATAGLIRMSYKDRITQILPPESCMHAVSQGALGIECRRDDWFVIKMLNELNHEETVLRCIAERTFLAKLEGGCSAPVGVASTVTNDSILLEGVVLDLDGSRRIQDKFEINFDASLDNLDCPILNQLNVDLSASNAEARVDEHGFRGVPPDEYNKSLKRVLDGDHEADDDEDRKRVKLNNEKLRHYSFITDMNISANKMIRAELCGLHLAEKLKERGADVLINEVKAIVHKS